MKRLIMASVLVFIAAPVVTAREQSVLARVTVYWAKGGSGSDRWTRRHVCSTGARLRVGHCAVDPRRIPYGSRVTLPDATLVAVDTGSAVRSRKAARRSGRNAMERGALVVDRFFETKHEALSWARRNPYFMFVRITPPPSLASSGSPQRALASPGISASQAAHNPAGPRRGLEAHPPRRPGWMP
ncbi:MAG TPA: 3D domain-containing protein [Chthoniobacterales bacterium]|jgi:3D (Asp-Asp-Asp) domain-containing protein|nr:3D domain-containing protein [Chthoniobacterales bacterium]